MLVRGTQDERPLELDFVSSPTTIYVRENIQKAESEDFSGWEYEEKTFPNDPGNRDTLTKWYQQKKIREQQEMVNALNILGVDVDG